ncbi:MAG: SDR family NAD(P)-dependent oxidoreductase [Pseudomonadota bacterium]
MIRPLLSVAILVCAAPSFAEDALPTEPSLGEAMTEKRVAVVTGAIRGPGKEVARHLAKEHGLKVYIGSRDLEKGRAAAQETGHDAEALQLDVSDRVLVDAAFAMIEAEVGRLEVLVNNAGADYDTDQRASTADLDRVNRAFETNLVGACAAIKTSQRWESRRVPI